MNSEHFFAFMLFAFVAAITPGPSNIILASTGASVGVQRGLPCLFGVATGMGLMVGLVGLGLGSLVLTHPIVLAGLKWAGIGFLFWLAWKTATAGRGSAATTPEIIGFWQAAALQWVNPKSWLVSASAIGAYFQVGLSPLTQSIFLGVLFTTVALPSCLIWLACGASLQRFLQAEAASKRFNVVMALLIAGSIVLFIR